VARVKPELSPKLEEIVNKALEKDKKLARRVTKIMKSEPLAVLDLHSGQLFGPIR
jgi:hypothetical protein